MLSTLTLLFLSGCHFRSEPVEHVNPDFVGEPTETVPSFIGRAPKNLIFISIDTFRRDHLDRYSGRNITPFMTQLAAEGYAMDAHHTCSNWTFAGVSCTIQGKMNMHAGHMPKLSKEGRAPFPASSTFLAEHLQERGYFTVLGSSNSWLGEEWNNDQGMDVSFQGTSNAFTLYSEAVRRLEAGMARENAENFFMHIHLIEPHVPYNPPDIYLTGLQGLPELEFDLTDKDEHYTTVRQDYKDLSEEEQSELLQHMAVRYDGELQYMDDKISLVFQDMRSRGLLKDTLVVFWTDHGEQFFEHGYQSHAYTLHGEENDGLAWFWSENIVPGSTQERTSSIDIAPTVMRLLTGEVPEDMTGYALGEAPAGRAIFGESVARLGARNMIIKDNWKLIFGWAGGIQLFDLENDPLEQNNLYTSSHPKAIELWPELEALVRQGKPLVDEFTIRWPTALQDNIP